MTPSVFRCPRCGHLSAHPDDKRYGYCGQCHDFTAPPVAPRVMVTGSRHWRDVDIIYERLRQLEHDTVIVHGAAKRGADRIADAAARALGLTVDPFPAKWGVGQRYNPRAGLERNDTMLDSGVILVLAFRARGVSNGTDHAIAGARKRGIDVEVHRPLPIGTPR